jgi:type VI secretion system protein ImpA
VVLEPEQSLTDDLAAASESGTDGQPAEPKNEKDAWGRIAVVARFLRQQAPTNPGPYMMLRGLRWGELRTASGEIDPKALAAPPTALRQQLKTLLLDGRWSDLLEACEGVMARPDSRGWLDLQRYAVTACDNLGAAYDAVGQAIRGAMMLLLRDFPRLPEMTLMDDTATANVETRQWLVDQRLIRTAEEVAAGTELPESESLGAPELRSVRDAPFERAREAVRGGQVKRAIEILSGEVDRERSTRAKFVRRIQLASVMVNAGMESLAVPILEDTVRQIDAHQLDQWEAGELVAQPLALLFHCLVKLDVDPDRRQELYLRIARLDPIQAMGLQS